MPAFAQRTVSEVLSNRPGLVRVRLDDDSMAYALTALTGAVGPGDDVIVNTTAVDRGLGTGGWHVVHWNLSAPPFVEPGPGHLMKLRYTSLQADTGAVEEHEPHLPTDLEGTPVVVAALHSQLPIVVAAVLDRRPATRIAYVMTDGGALPLALSDVVADLTARGLLAGTVTAGHAFGGDHEALNVPSALATARHGLEADVIVVAMGPGVAGTASRLGFTGLDAAPALDAAAWLGGRPVACLRCSSADLRPRHLGISHHSLTVLDAVRSEVDVALVAGLERPLGDRHRWHHLTPHDPAAMLGRFGLVATSMGRGPAEDPLFFSATAAAGQLAVELLPVRS